MLVTLSGIFADESEEQFWNTDCSMLVTPSGIVMDSKEEQLAKA